KTGYFLAGSGTRWGLGRSGRGRRGRGVFCHTGPFAVPPCHCGGREGWGVARWARAAGSARRNAALNGHGASARFVQANAFDFLRELDRSGERFDVVILDPPAFAKSKSHFEPARRGYKEGNQIGRASCRESE